MEKIKKYLLFAFIIENVAAQTSIFGGLTNMFFYLFLGLGVMLIFTSNIRTQGAGNTFWWAYALGAIYLVYEFVVMPETISERSLLYVLAKIITMIIIIVCVSSNFTFYYKRMLYPLALLLCFFILYGLVTGQGMNSNVAGERLSLGYANENTTSWMGAMAAGLLLYSGKSWGWKEFVFLGIAFYGVLAGGSRAGLLLLLIILIARYGFTKKVVISILAGYIVAVFLLPAIGLNTVGIERVQDTITGIETSNRSDEREAAEMMINKKPWTGWGFEAKNEGQAKLISELGSHSGYLETFKFMGYPLGGLWLCIVIGSIIGILVWHYKNKVALSFFEAYLIALPVCAFYEDVFTGVHEIETNFFYISLGISSFKVACMRCGELPLVEDSIDSEVIV